MAAMGSVSLLSVQARPARQFSFGNKSGSARPRSAAVMAVSKASRQDQVQNVAHKALALLAATQLLAAGPALADGPLESFTNAFKGDKTGAAIGGAVSGEGKEKTGVSDASSQVAESIKISQSPNSNEADSIADKFSKDTPSSGAPSTAGVGKSMGTTDGRG